MRPVAHLSSSAATATQHQPAPPPQQQHSTWRSPVPYLFGGLAAMMGLIAFALLLLACSYWRLSGYLEEGSGGVEGGDPESGAGKPDDAGVAKAPPRPPEQRVVVIMAGEEKPTFLATPVSSRVSSFGDSASRGRDGDEDGKRGDKNKPVTETGGDAHIPEAAEDGGRQQEETQESQEGTQQNHNRSENRESSHDRLERETSS